ncbi:MAG: DUF411 domain-containing protein [Spirulinaceae cyanobacterium]
MHPYLKTPFLAAGLLAFSLVLTSCAAIPTSQAEPEPLAIAPDVELTVFRSPTCGCCGAWIEHMEAAGFRIKDEVTEEMEAIKTKYGIANELESCHTTLADGYIVEGHIPATDVARLLTERPDVAGIAVPGMPIGSPGMESGDYVEPYQVFSFTEEGTTEIFAEHS